MENTEKSNVTTDDIVFMNNCKVTIDDYRYDAGCSTCTLLNRCTRQGLFEQEILVNESADLIADQNSQLIIDTTNTLLNVNIRQRGEGFKIAIVGKKPIMNILMSLLLGEEKQDEPD